MTALIRPATGESKAIGASRHDAARVATDAGQMFASRYPFPDGGAIYRMGPRVLSRPRMGRPPRDANQSACLVCVTLAAVALAIWVAACVVVFPGGLRARPASLAYYAGHVLAGAARGERGRRAGHFGSVGDGDKAPRSEGVLRGVAWQRDDAYASMDAYLQSRGFQPRPAEAAGMAAALADGEELVRHAECPVRASWCWRCPGPPIRRMATGSR